MKKIISIILISIIIASLLVGCSNQKANESSLSNQNQQQESKKLTIAVIPKALDSEFWLDLKNGAEKAAQENNVDLIVLAPDKESNVEQQFRIIEDMIQRKVDALLIAPCDSSGVVPFIEKANESNIPVFTIDTNADGGKIVSFIGTDNILGGKIAGERVIKLLNGKGKVGLILGVPGQQTMRDRADGFKEAIKAAPDIKLVAEQPANSERALAMTVMENILQAHPDINAVFAASTLMAMGALEAVEAAGKIDQVKIIGFDSQKESLEAIKAGKLDSLVAQNPFNMGYLGVKAAIDYINGKDVPNRIDTGTELVTKENVDKYLK
ncbi:sugar ABC transporter substrate-binding protein [Thermosediminibacter litoriperuensis]|uniref:Ribose transport system substrate-binding protein n=1 Tax=Thermosediminibacter litoriperuensis TaxID=291989 RepID=A0A5S5AGN6_9FIRM|nr:sugar ABC transporter substrate-binding protein [Thermosediminibacter litoriperuensis]TYP47896.1 ribose transport system substrate-binding protein [Thermosediminibacter litoriperuensis]